ncbi:hypothetical protein JKP88DRAFT_251008 [Tribonema minus]|uniref:Helicase ATP-binding domain-containing protein n=1 Tax=Tribonema minus TaxID=303371 RepID=A0A836CQR8_9STRA|nr:hypothetical protein JKP88DRAFT_251008 [Tribonema minus]
MAGTTDWFEYELFACAHHRLSTGHDVWHWHTVGDDLLLASGFVDSLNKARLARINRDCTSASRQEYGLDAIARDENGVHHGLQMKLWNARKLTAADVATFTNVIAFRMARKNAEARGFLYTSTRLQIDLDEDMTRSGLFHVHHLPFAPVAEKSVYDLRPYQVEALRALGAGWSGLGALIMPCASGKTLVYANHALRYRRVVVLSPLRVSAKQNLDRIRDILGSAFTSLLVDSDGGESTRDVDRVRSVWGEDRALVSATYQSALDVLKEAIFCEPLDASTLVIVDEAHNANSELFRLLQACRRVLLCTATPTASLAQEDENDCGAQLSWRDSVKTLFRYSFADAIHDRWICDYEVRLPLIEGECVDTLGMQARFVLDGLTRTGARRIIIYCGSINECSAFLAAIRRVAFDFHGIDEGELWTENITCDVTGGRRQEILGQFQHGRAATYYVLASVRILDEAIDVPKCDSVAILHPSQASHLGSLSQRLRGEDAGSWRRMVQRMCRAVRLDEQHPHKIARVFLWLPDGDFPRCLHVLRQYDPSFFKKISVQSFAVYDDLRGEELWREAAVTTQAQAKYRVRCLTKDEIWDSKISRVIEYIEQHGKMPSQHWVAEDGFKGGSFAHDVRRGKAVISEAQRLRILDADATFFTLRRDQKGDKIERIIEYIERHDGKRPPHKFVGEDGVKIGLAVREFRHGVIKLSEPQRQQLLAADTTFFTVEPRARPLERDAKRSASTDARIEMVLEYISQHGTRPPGGFIADGFKLGRFVQRMRHNGLQVSAAQKETLLAADPTFFDIAKNTDKENAAGDLSVSNKKARKGGMTCSHKKPPMVENNAVKIAVDTDVLAHVAQSWFPTTTLVCTEWHSAHKDKHIAEVALPEDMSNLAKALDDGMPFVSAAVTAACAFLELQNFWCRRDLRDHFNDLSALVDKHSDVTTASGKATHEEFYYHYIRYTFDLKYGVLDHIDYMLEYTKEPDRVGTCARMLEHCIYPIAHAVARVGDIETLEHICSKFVFAACEQTDHFESEEGIDACDCRDHFARKVFAQAVLEECDDEDMDMLDWADAIMFEAGGADGVDDDDDDDDNEDMDT